MKNRWLIIAVLFPALSFSQKPGFQAIVSVGAAGGESTVKPLVQVAGGINYNNRFFTGIGVGLDQYRFQSIPLFADWRMDIGRHRSVFLFANGGYNFSYGKTGEDLNGFITAERLNGGFYFDTGLGYRLRLNQSHRLLFSAGYSQKNLVSEQDHMFPCFSPPCNVDTYRNYYNLGRITAKMSWEFGN